MRIFRYKVVLTLVIAFLCAPDIVLSQTASSSASYMSGRHSGVRVSGIDGNPNGAMNLYVRGVNTLRGDSQPLWIVDGAVIGSSVNQNLNAFYLTGGKTINGDKLPDYTGKSYASVLKSMGWLNPYEIESVEVIKDIAATSKYGMAGANGVIIVNTRKPKSGKDNVWLNSNVGADVSSIRGAAFKPGIRTTHDLGIGGLFGTGSFYNVAGFVSYDSGAIVNANSLAGGLTLNLETIASERFHFGLNSRLACNHDLSSSGTNFIGAPSVMTISRMPEIFSTEKLDSWFTSYDDEVFDYRTVNSIWLGINIIPCLKLRMNGGIDYQNQTRLIWYGTGTSFGKEFKGATSILNNSLLNANFDIKLSFDRRFATMHHLQAEADFDINAYANRTNAMCGTNFDLPGLRGKGLSSSSSLHAIRKFNRKYSRLGGYVSVGYDYDAFAGVNAVMRLDRTARFDTKVLILPSVQAYVDFKRVFLKDNDIVSSLKLSGGYGQAGQEDVLPYEYITSYVPDVPSVEQGAEPYFDGMIRLLSSEYNLGVDAGFAKGRYNVSLKYYDKTTEDTFRIYDFSKMLSGLWVATENWKLFHQRVSSIHNRGVELDADMIFVLRKNLRWSAGLSAAYNINIATALDQYDANAIASISRGTYAAEFVEGRSLGQVLGKNTIPKVHGGFQTSLFVHGVTLEADLSGAAGFNIFNANRYIQRGLGRISEGDIERGDFLRLDRLSVSYDVPLKVKWMKRLQVSVSANNLFVLTGYSGWNPDVNSFAGVTTRSFGVDYGSYPLLRSVVLGLGVTF